MTEVAIPAALGLDPQAPVSAIWTGGGHLLVAGRDEDEGLAVLAAVGDGAGRRIWMAKSTALDIMWEVPTGPVAQLAALPDGTALALIADGPLLAIAPGAQSVRTVPQPRPIALLARPDRTGIIAVLRSAKSQRLSLADISEPAQPALAGWDLRQTTRRPGPDLGAGQTLSLALTDRAGRLVLGVDDGTAGFHLLREEADGFTPLAVPGAARHGLNACLLAAVRWNGVQVLSAGSGAATRDDIPGLCVAGEVLILDEAGSGDLAILAGELRTGPKRLLAPALPGSHPLMQARIGADVDFVGLAVWDGTLVLHLRDDWTGTEQLYQLHPDFSGRVLPTAGPIATLVQGPDGPIALTWDAEA